MDLAVTVDTLVCGVHFPQDATPADIGYKALAVNLSDLAAMGALPDWAAVSLTIPESDEAWISEFHNGMHQLAKRYSVRFPVGDFGIGPLAITLQIYGQVPRGQALRRDSARVGDLIFVTGTPGDAGLALAGRASPDKIHIPVTHRQYLEGRLARPSPRVREGIALRGIATAAIDISDGLAADLSHITDASQVGAIIEVQRLPLSHTLQALPERERVWQLALSFGDDYELCFTVPPARHDTLLKVAEQFSCPITQIGRITKHPGVQILDQDGKTFSKGGGYQHFACAEKS
uniref:Thiamine-monophosphate kinase n=1 Tax=Candidatus Kentrum sp. TUN TaxID=2126343 RepID=A0A450ZY97_9GAMM|nr:MAG: thiamine-phosphate kinase [Candidatus Kentron sp. TUN]VFK63303.1 MAG: thiamine-phosphate kinase [Candidatus Kentron sp. TUN]VFK67460.1 MAG: thiamine-phosphate kinase [Candidatus Kentron sp. TUN]